jgi:hypothetical protein
MSTESLVIGNVVVINDIPDTFCFTTTQEFILALTKFLGVELPNSITNVIISNNQPLDDQRDSLWVRRNNAGVVVGIYVFTDGLWQQRFPAPREVFWMYALGANADGETDVPKGYTLADEANPALPPGLGLKLKTEFDKINVSDSFYIYFAATLDVG